MKRVIMSVRKYFGCSRWPKSRMFVEKAGLTRASQVWSEGSCRQQS